MRAQLYCLMSSGGGIPKFKMFRGLFLLQIEGIYISLLGSWPLGPWTLLIITCPSWTQILFLSFKGRQITLGPLRKSRQSLWLQSHIFKVPLPFKVTQSWVLVLCHELLRGISTYPPLKLICRVAQTEWDSSFCSGELFVLSLLPGWFALSTWSSPPITIFQGSVLAVNLFLSVSFHQPRWKLLYPQSFGEFSFGILSSYSSFTCLLEYSFIHVYT